MTTPAILSIDICVCAFRRPQLADTLASLTAQQVPAGWRLRVIVADNDDTPAAKALVDSHAAAAPFPVRYIHAPARNISVARNACLDAAQAELIAFIDDDETAAPEWLAALAASLYTQQVDAVLGPVKALYAAAPAWLRNGDFHSTRPVWVRGEIVTGYTCNVLLRREIVTRLNLRFDPDLGQTGGEDTLFFAALAAGGGRIGYAENALVTEIVTPARARFSWLLRRSFRSGQTHGRLLRRRGGSRLSQIIVAATKAGFCLLISALHLGLTIAGRRWLLRGALHLGVVACLCGGRELRPYG